MSHTFKPLTKEPVYLKVYQAIEGDILSGVLLEGAFLPTEAALCAQFQVTRSSVREGIRLLEQAGLVARGRGKRLVVIRPKTDDIAERASRSLTHGGVTFGEVWETLSMLYPQAAQLAAKRLKRGALTELRSVTADLEATKSAGADDVVGAAVEFFQRLARALDNRVLFSMLQSMNILIGASLKRVIDENPNAKRRIVKAQREIVAALEAGDGEAAANWMSKHIDDLKRGYRQADMGLDSPVL